MISGQRKTRIMFVTMKVEGWLGQEVVYRQRL